MELAAYERWTLLLCRELLARDASIVSEEREELSLRLALSALIRLAQERNTLLLEAVGILRDMAKDVKALTDDLPQPPGQLKRTVFVFGAPQS